MNNSQFSETLTNWFGFFYHRLMDEFMQFTRKYGLTLLQMNLLLHLYYRGSLEISQIVETMQVTKGATSQMVERLVKLELVERHEDPRDRRVKKISLTEKGRSQIESSINARRNWLDQVASQLPPESQQSVLQSLDLLMRSVQQIDSAEKEISQEIPLEKHRRAT